MNSPLENREVRLCGLWLPASERIVRSLARSGFGTWKDGAVPVVLFLAQHVIPNNWQHAA